MATLSYDDLRRLAATASQICALENERTFARDTLALLQQLVPFDSASYNELAPGRDINSAVVYPEARAIAAQRLLPLFAQLSDQNPLVTRAARTGDGRALRLDDLTTQRRFRELGLYRDFYRPLGVEHQLAIGLRASHAQVVGVALNRERTRFSDEERLLLDLIRPHLATAWQRIRMRRQLDALLAALERPIAPGDGVMIVAGQSAAEALMTARARELLARYGGSATVAETLPPPLRTWLDQARLRAANGVQEPLTIRRNGAVLHVQLLPRVTPDADDTLILRELATEHAFALTPHPRLSAREQQVLRLLAEGESNRAIADALAIGERTVHKHVQRIFTKLGVNSRARAAAWAFQHHAVGL